MDGISTPAAAFEVARIANNVCRYINSVRNAEKQFKPIGEHVKVLSTVLENVGNFLSDESVRKECTPALISSTDQALSGCRSAFGELEVFLKSLCRQDKSGNITLTTKAKLAMNFKQDELYVLQTHLERFKSSLDLILGVLNLAMSMRRNNDRIEIQRLRRTVRRLIEYENEQRVKSSTSVKAPSVKGKPLKTRRNIFVSDGVGESTRAPPATVSLPSADGNVSESTQTDTSSYGTPSPPPAARSRSKTEETLLSHLEMCAEAVARLTATIEQTKLQLQHSQTYERQSLSPAFQAARQAVEKLHLYELDVDFDSSGVVHLKRDAAGPTRLRSSRLRPRIPSLRYEYSRRSPEPGPTCASAAGRASLSHDPRRSAALCAVESSPILGRVSGDTRRMTLEDVSTCGHSHGGSAREELSSIDAFDDVAYGRGVANNVDSVARDSVAWATKPSRSARMGNGTAGQSVGPYRTGESAVDELLRKWTYVGISNDTYTANWF